MDTMETTAEVLFDFDIIEAFPHEICRNIFQNLSSKDLLSASLVSSEWYNFIARTAACMQKIKLSFSHRTAPALTPEVKQILMNSIRKYESIEFMYHSDVFRDVKDILEVPGRNWKSLSICRINFPTTSDCITLLAAVEATVEELRMDKVYVDSVCNDFEQTKMTFPKLKVLEAKYIQTLIYCQAFASCSSLQEFHITSGDQSVTSIAAIHNMFQCNKGLKKLSIVTNVFTQYFSEDISKKIGFQLTEFEARDIYNLGDDHKSHFKQFLRTQIMSLETLQIGDWMGIEIVQMIFHMPKLKKFVFKGLHSVEETLDWKEVKFHRNTTITDLYLSEVKSRQDILEAFVSATPNVKQLKLYSMNDENLAYISKALPDLESLTTDLFEVSDVSDKNLFPNLKKFSSKVFRHEIKVTEDDEEKGSFEKMVAQTIKDVCPGQKDPKRHNCHGHSGHFHWRFVN